jgi:vacuolar protein sorting-associated protein 45
MLNFAGAEQRQDDLFANENFFSRGKSAFKGLQGVENVYTQHTPHLVETIDSLVRGRLRESSYPFIEGQQGITRDRQVSARLVRGVGRARSSDRCYGFYSRPQDVIIFVIGGSTYEEARAVAKLNEQLASGLPGSSQGFSGGGATRLLLGGTGVLNSKECVFCQGITN